MKHYGIKMFYWAGSKLPYSLPHCPNPKTVKHPRRAERCVGDFRSGHVEAAARRLPFEDGKIYVLRVVVDEDDQPLAIVTVYRTSKIEKYWSAG